MGSLRKLACDPLDDKESKSSTDLKKEENPSLIPDSPVKSSNRRSLLRRGMGSLRNLKSRGRNKRSSDLPPVRPMRNPSVRNLQLEDIEQTVREEEDSGGGSAMF